MTQAIFDDDRDTGTNIFIGEEKTQTMKALILSCNTGGGHNSAGLALKERIEAQGGEACFLDYLTLAGKKVSQIVGDGYVGIVKKTPILFGLIYRLGALVSRLTKRSPVYYVNGMMAKYLGSFLRENDFDVILMPHLYPAETITYMKRKGMPLPLTVAVATDYTCIPFWGETECDYYMIPHGELTEEFATGKIETAQIYASGIPVSMECARQIPRKEAKDKLYRKLGLQTEREEKLLLVIGGSMGAGNLRAFTRAIYLLKKRTDRILVVCGSNERIKRKLERIFRKRDSVTVLGKTDEMPLFLKAADVVYTKPGGLTLTEAAVTGTALVLTSPIPGCETQNRRFFRKHGMCVSGRNIYAQAAAGIRLLKDRERAEKIKANQQEFVPGDASLRIYRFIEEKLQEKDIHR